MGWDLGLSRTISRLIPTFMRNPRTYQWLKSLVFPLENINGYFKVFAAVKKREAQLSSQTKLLEDYINVNLSQYFPNPDTDSVQIVHGIETAQATFFEVENPDPNPPFSSGHLIVYNEAEDVNIETITTNSEYIAIQNNKILSSVLDLEFEVSGTWDLGTGGDTAIINWGNYAPNIGHINVRVLATGDLQFLVLDGIGGSASHLIKSSVTQSDFTNLTLKLVGGVVYMDGVEISELLPTLSSIALNIDLSQECRVSHYNTLAISFTSSIIHGCKLSGEIFNFNENTGSVVTGSNGTTGALISTANTEDMWGDDNGAKESPFTYFDYEDFGTLPEDFRLILPLSIEGNQRYVRSITSIVDRYAISTKSYDVVYTRPYDL